jgi:hypothetical protein
MSETHETATADTYQMIPRLTGDNASSRAEDSSSFSQKCCTKCNIFVKKKKHTMLPQANKSVVEVDTNVPPNVQETLAGHAERAAVNRTYTRDHPHYLAVRVPSWSSWSSWLVEFLPFGSQIGMILHPAKPGRTTQIVSVCSTREKGKLSGVDFFAGSQ